MTVPLVGGRPSRAQLRARHAAERERAAALPLADIPDPASPERRALERTAPKPKRPGPKRPRGGRKWGAGRPPSLIAASKARNVARARALSVQAKAIEVLCGYITGGLPCTPGKRVTCLSIYFRQFCRTDKLTAEEARVLWDKLIMTLAAEMRKPTEEDDEVEQAAAMRDLERDIEGEIPPDVAVHEPTARDMLLRDGEPESGPGPDPPAVPLGAEVGAPDASRPPAAPTAVPDFWAPRPQPPPTPRGPRAPHPMDRRWQRPWQEEGF